MDYLRTRAVGLKTHLLDSLEYDDLIKIDRISELVDRLKSNYGPALSKYFTTESELDSFVLAIHYHVNSQWSLLTKYASGKFEETYKIYTMIIDVFNYLTIISQFDLLEEFSEPTVLLDPQGSIDIRIWKEISQSESVRQANMKLKIIEPSFWQMLEDFNLLAEESEIEFLIFLLRIITELSRVSTDDSHKEVLPIIMVEFVNKILIRVAMYQQKLDEKIKNQIFEVIQPWVGTNLILGGANFGSVDEKWLDIIHQEILSELNRMNHSKQLQDTINPAHYEIVLSFITISRLKKLARYPDNILHLVFQILLKIKLEGKNLVWLAYCIVNGLPDEVKKERLMLV